MLPHLRLAKICHCWGQFLKLKQRLSITLHSPAVCIFIPRITPIACITRGSLIYLETQCSNNCQCKSNTAISLNSLPKTSKANYSTCSPISMLKRGNHSHRSTQQYYTYIGVSVNLLMQYPMSHCNWYTTYIFSRSGFDLISDRILRKLGSLINCLVDGSINNFASTSAPSNGFTKKVL